ncbi:hypothetical protein GBAR_LOCUS12959 [Geodia barretti]|uniref:Uncharacterized protein n=1 Tax=Geodia barretti TaxID=519541 RepID=A0AA35WHW1_GEOBA|nr:hypothetical protein GBAR_LOCUS12959 [Geodia barretti]
MEKRLPEISLRWSDFSGSLEKLRYKTYTKNSTDRDWFRINPLELLLLGCQTLSTGVSTKREYGTMVLVMESIEAPMRLRPRYWKWLFTVLIAICKEDISPFVFQRCVSTFTGVWKSLIKFPKFQPSVYTWCINEVSLISFLEWLIESKKDTLGQHQMNEVTLLLEEVKETLQESKKQFTLNKEDLSAIVTQNAWEPMVLELLLMKRHKSTVLMSLREESVKKLIHTLKTVSSDLSTSLSYLLGILQVLNVSQEEKGEPPADSEEEQHAENKTEVTAPESLYAALTAALTTWSSLQGQDERFPSGGCDIASQLLSLSQVILTSGPLPETLTVTTDFFTHTISTLMIYSTEGYLSNSPHKFFCELIEFVSSLVEQGIPPLTVVQTYLPNLFGPVFGTNNHSVSCKLLEYGYLAACSQHQKSLLSEGLTFLVKVYNLFPPLDKARIELAANLRHLQTLEIVNSLLDDIITSVVNIPNDEKAFAQSLNSGEKDQQTGGYENSEVFLVEVTDDERESENKTRLQILFRLLDLACAMVRNGDNVSFLFASTLPKLFTGSFPSCLKEKLHVNQNHYKELLTGVSIVPWQVDKKEFALHLLELATLSLESDNASPFQICGVVAPKLVQNIDTLRLSDSEKMATTVEIMSITSDAIRNGQTITELISHGIDLLTVLIPESTTPKDARQFVAQMTKQLVVFNHSSLLFMLKQSCNFMLSKFPDERLPIQQLFKTLIQRGKRDEVRAMFRLCRSDFESDMYTDVRHHLYSFSSGTLKHRQFIALCEILVAIMDVGKPSPVNRRTPDMEEETGKERNEELIVLVVRKLTQPCLVKLVRCLSTDRFKQQNWVTITEEISKIALFRTLFDSEFSTLTNLSEMDVYQFFERYVCK